MILEGSMAAVVCMPCVDFYFFLLFQIKRSMRRAVEEEDYKTAGDLRNEMAAIRAKVGAAVASKELCVVCK